MPRKLEDLPTFMHEALLDNGWIDGRSHWSAREILDCWLTWTGIQGYTDQIITAMKVLGEAAPAKGYKDAQG